jgi:hypothetical protein
MPTGARCMSWVSPTRRIISSRRRPSCAYETGAGNPLWEIRLPSVTPYVSPGAFVVGAGDERLAHHLKEEIGGVRVVAQVADVVNGDQAGAQIGEGGERRYALSRPQTRQRNAPALTLFGSCQLVLGRAESRRFLPFSPAVRAGACPLVLARW